MADHSFADASFSEMRIKDVFPPNWKNPQPAEIYDLLVIGGGPGGMTATTIGRSLKAKVALVEKAHLGGECLNVGCIPSKALLRCSRLAYDIQHASAFGIKVPNETQVDFKAVMERVYRMQATISPHDSALHFQSLGADVFLGTGRFINDHQLEVGSHTLHFRKAIITTGTQPIPLAVPGLGPLDYLTNQTIFNLSSLPSHLAVIGGGAMSCELAQGFCRLGSRVTMIIRGDHLLPKDDLEATKRLHQILEEEGIRVITQAQVQRVEKEGTKKRLYLDKNQESLTVDEILVGVGRMPTVEGLGLDAAGVAYDTKKGIHVNRYLQTSHPHIYAAGDVCSAFKFTHLSKELAKIAVLNALKGHHRQADSLIVPWCTYTDPEIAHTGMTEKEIQDRGLAVESIMLELADIDRAILDGETKGFVKLFVKAGSDEIVGATIVARHAGEMISELTVAMQSDKSLLTLSQAIHPFPTQSQVLRSAAEALMKKRQLVNV